MQSGTNSRMSLSAFHKRSIRELTECALIARTIANAARANRRRLLGPACGRSIIRAGLSPLSKLRGRSFTVHGRAAHVARCRLIGAA